jgi:hypothetical protein
MPAPLHHAERAWDYFNETNALTRDMSVNMIGLAKVIATLQEAGLLSADVQAEPSFYVNHRYLRAARAG